MKLVILAGGLGTRIAEETDIVPKPMVLIGDKPILWHIIKYFSEFNFSEFIICGGYKIEIIKNFFKNFENKSSKLERSWKVKVVNTGKDSNTGERLKRIKKYVGESFCLTYGDGLSDVNLKKLINFHKKNKKKATVVAVQPPARFGSLRIKKEKVIKFSEKTQNTNSWINGGFFVLRKEVIKLIKNDLSVWERHPLEYLAKKKELIAFKHKKFWMAMDTLREKKLISKIYKKGNAPWKKW